MTPRKPGKLRKLNKSSTTYIHKLATFGHNKVSRELNKMAGSSLNKSREMSVPNKFEISSSSSYSSGSGSKS